MLARILRLAVILAIVAVVFVLFVYAFLAALILVPVLLLLFSLFGRRIRTKWVVGQPMSGAGESMAKYAPPVIDHDPNDLPEKER